MTVFDIGKYNIQFNSAPNYNKNSSDNLNYDEVIIVEEDEDFCRTKVVEISDGIKTRRIAMVVPYYTPEDFAVKADNRVFLMLNEILCYFDPEKGEIVEKKEIPMEPMYGAYAFENDFILHGELTIFRVDRNLEIKWKFSAKDIFVRCGSDEPAFIMKEDRICLYDFEENYYEIDYDGKVIKEQLNH